MNIFYCLSNSAPDSKRKIIELFNDNARHSTFSVSAAKLHLDFSKQNISSNELSTLLMFGYDCEIPQKINSMFSGEAINNTEQRSVLHSLLRSPQEVKRRALGTKAESVEKAEEKVAAIVDDIHLGKFKSFTKERFTDVVVIGIGGSFYGVKLSLSALSSFNTCGLNVHVLANVDGVAVEEKLAKLNAETTLVIVISKTFTTQETILNAHTIKQWMLNELITEEAITQQWFAVSSDVDKAIQFGIDKDKILPMWDWVGGRFSVWSAVGLPLALAIGNENFEKFKLGAYEMDKHFQEAELCENMPVLMALIGIWNRNVLGYQGLAILPYDHSLRAFPGYMQQIDMESNGKSVDVNGKHISWDTAPIVFGQEGTNGQHAFMQLMHQSKDIIPADFIVSLRSSSSLKEHHKALVANCFAQSEALMMGVTLEQAEKELKNEADHSLAPHKVMKGNTPSNTILLESVTPESIGALFALYEHKIFVQGVLWQINSFDQWGVELGKKLSSQVLSLMDNTGTDINMSASSTNLIKAFQKANKSTE